MKKLMVLALLAALPVMSSGAMAQTASSGTGYTPPWERASGSSAFVNGRYVPPWQRSDGSGGASANGSASGSTEGAASGPASGARTVASASGGEPAGQGGFAASGGSGERARGPGDHDGPPGERGPQLAEIKARIEQRMNEHIAEIQKRLACVQAASTPDALRACMPERGGREGGEEHADRGPPGMGERERSGSDGGGRFAQGGPQNAPGNSK